MNVLDRIKFNMIGGGFQHDVCSSALNTNKYVDWVKDGSADISIFIDGDITSGITFINKRNFGWFAESSSMLGGLPQMVLNNLDGYKKKFEFIFTHDRRIIEIDPSFFKFVPPNACSWIQNKKIYEKSKLVSAILSNKTFSNGHKFRLKKFNELPIDKIDHFGRGVKNELPWLCENNESGKILGLKDYYFSFAFENNNYPSIFCEKVTDCFATGTIPIFWGTPDIDLFFDKEGIIIFDDNFNFDDLSPEFYFKKIEHVKNNLEICKNLITSEDYIYLNYIK